MQAESALRHPRLGIDPGNKTTGLALARLSKAVEAQTGDVIETRHALFLAELPHCGPPIREGLDERRAFRRRRRGANLRHRTPRFDNRTRCALYRALQATTLAIEAATDGRTKWNRSRVNLPKAHAIDALRVGKVDLVTA